MVRRQKCIRLLTREEETALGRLKPLVVRHLDLLLETMILFIGSDPKGVRLLQDAGGVDRLKKWQREYLLNLFDGNRHQGTAKNAVDPLGLGRGWHLRLLAHVVSVVFPHTATNAAQNLDLRPHSWPCAERRSAIRIWLPRSR